MSATIHHCLPTLLGLLVKVTALLLAAGAACLLLRRSSAATRHLIWTAALAGALLLPILSASLPRWNVRYPRAAVSPRPVVAPPVVVQAPPPSGALDLRPVVTTPPAEAALHENIPPPVVAAVPAEAAGHGRGLPLPRAATALAAGLAVWLVGSLGVLLHLAVGVRRVGRLGRQAVALQGETVLVAEAAQRQIGPRRPVRFLRAAEGGGVAVPVTWGVLRPVVLLPPQSTAWSEDCLRAALLHELAHAVRGDWGTQLLARLACALYWWHPLVWWAARRARAEGERGCDDLVLGTGMRPADYAQRLVEVVRSMPVGTPARTVAVAMAQPSEVEGRVKAVRAGGRKRRAPSRRRVLGVALALALGLGPVAALRLSPMARAADQAPSLAQGADQAPADAAPLPLGATSDPPIDGSESVTYSVASPVTLPNGYQVSLQGVTQATRVGDEWDMYGGPWWSPQGTPVGPQSGGLSGHWHWKVLMTHGWAPFVIATKVTNPAQLRGRRWSPDRLDYSVYVQLLGACQPAQYSATTHTVGPYPTVGTLVGPLTDGSAPRHFQGDVGGVRNPALYSPGTRACVVRCGVAAGPWRTVASRPFTLTPASVTPDVSQSARYRTDVYLFSDGQPREVFFDERGRQHIVYFLGRDARLPNVARRFVAVDAAGRVLPLSDFGAQKVALSFDRRSDVTRWNPSVVLSHIRRIRLQTRPYQTAVFLNVQLQPLRGAANTRSSAAAWMTRFGAQQLGEAQGLRAHLRGWAQDNRALLQTMAGGQPTDLTPLFHVYASLGRLPFPLWQGDPRVGHGGDDPPFASELPSRLTLTHLGRSQDAVETRMRDDYARFRDLEVAQSVNVGPAHLTLWASGRITRSIMTDQSTGMLQPIETSESQQEIVPAYFGGGVGNSGSPPPPVTAAHSPGPSEGPPLTGGVAARVASVVRASPLGPSRGATTNLRIAAQTAQSEADAQADAPQHPKSQYPAGAKPTAHFALGMGKHADYRITLPRGISTVVLDIRRSDGKWNPQGASTPAVLDTKSRLSYFDVRGRLIHGGPLDRRFVSVASQEVEERAVDSLSLEQPAPVTLDIDNQGVSCDYWLTVVPSPPAGSVTPVASPALAVPLFGQIVPMPMAVGADSTGRLAKNGYAYFAIPLKAGRYQASLEFGSVSGRATSLNGCMRLNDENSITRNGVAMDVAELHADAGWSPPYRSGRAFTLKGDGVFLVTVVNQGGDPSDADGGSISYVAKITPAALNDTPADERPTAR